MKMDTKLSNQSPLLNQLIKGLHIEPTNICTLKCPGCARTRFIEQWPRHWKNHSLNIQAVMSFLDVDLQGIKVQLCGNYGDPIYHPEFVEFVCAFKNRGAHLEIVTNGSYKTVEWWQKLTDQLTDQDRIVFSVDGLQDTVTEYRINCDWPSIYQAMTVAAQSSCQTQWKYIPFKFNQHQIEQARQLSQQIGIDVFLISPSDRFDQHTEKYKPDSSFLTDTYQKKVQWHTQNHQSIDPKCAAGVEHFISAQGHYSACCFTADHRFYYKTEFGKNKKSYNIADQTLTQVLARPAVVEFYNNLTTHPVCCYNCPAT